MEKLLTEDEIRERFGLTDEDFLKLFYDFCGIRFQSMEESDAYFEKNPSEVERLANWSGKKS
jgi:hypothetical protein